MSKENIDKEIYDAEETLNSRVSELERNRDEIKFILKETEEAYHSAEKECSDLRSQLTAAQKELAEAKEVLREVSMPPYKDSDLKSLLETLRIRAKTLLDRYNKKEAI